MNLFENTDRPAPRDLSRMVPYQLRLPAPAPDNCFFIECGSRFFQMYLGQTPEVGNLVAVRRNERLYLHCWRPGLAGVIGVLSPLDYLT